VHGRTVVVRPTSLGASKEGPPKKPPSFSLLLGPGMHQFDEEIARIAVPCLFTLLADPFLSIVDTAYVGR
jgi:Na+-driven multidrug efflux pump